MADQATVSWSFLANAYKNSCLQHLLHFKNTSQRRHTDCSGRQPCHHALILNLLTVTYWRFALSPSHWYSTHRGPHLSSTFHHEELFCSCMLSDNLQHWCSGCTNTRHGLPTESGGRRVCFFSFPFHVHKTEWGAFSTAVIRFSSTGECWTVGRTVNR